MTSKHTPGPWHFESPKLAHSGALIRSGEGPQRVIIAEAWPMNVNDSQTENARLIAAAPDVLAALLELTEEVCTRITQSGADFDPAILNRARAAIAKAVQS